MKTCLAGEIWFCNARELARILVEWAAREDIEVEALDSGDCIVLQGRALHARVCSGPSGMLSSISYRVCRVEVLADEGLCRRIKIVFMRGGG